MNFIPVCVTRVRRVSAVGELKAKGVRTGRKGKARLTGTSPQMMVLFVLRDHFTWRDKVRIDEYMEMPGARMHLTGWFHDQTRRCHRNLKCGRDGFTFRRRDKADGFRGRSFLDHYVDFRTMGVTFKGRVGSVRKLKTEDVRPGCQIQRRFERARAKVDMCLILWDNRSRRDKVGIYKHVKMTGAVADLAGWFNLQARDADKNGYLLRDDGVIGRRLEEYGRCDGLGRYACRMVLLPPARRQDNTEEQDGRDRADRLENHDKRDLRW